MDKPLPVPFAEIVAEDVGPKVDPETGEAALVPSADDDVSGMTTWTDD